MSKVPRNPSWMSNHNAILEEDLSGTHTRVSRR